jgi:hypothetical protein
MRATDSLIKKLTDIFSQDTTRKISSGMMVGKIGGYSPTLRPLPSKVYV